MKKRLLAILLTLGLLIPSITSAKTYDLSDYNVTDLKEAIADSGLDVDAGSFKNSDDKEVTLYLFRGKTCGYCHKLITWLATDIVPTYGDKINIKTFEVWNDSDNASLMDDVAALFDEEANGVPYLVIGDKTYVGFSESIKNNIKEGIENLLNSEEKFDVIYSLNGGATPKKADKQTAAIVILAILVLLVLALVVYSIAGAKKEDEDTKEEKEEKTLEETKPVEEVKKVETKKASTKKTTTKKTTAKKTATKKTSTKKSSTKKKSTK